MDKFDHHTDAGLLAVKSVARALTYRWRLILCVAIAPVLLTLLVCWTIQPRYSATARMLIDPRPRQIMENEIAKTGMGTSYQGGDVLMLDSQMKILDSRDMLTRVVIALGLDRKEDATSFSRLHQIAHWIEHGPFAAGLPEHSSMDLAIMNLRSSLRIDRIGNTYVYDITVTSPDRIEAADVANGVINSYVQLENENYRSRVQENVDALNKLVATLRAESDSANQQLVAFRAQADNLDGSNGQTGSGSLFREILQNDIQTQVELSRQNLRIVSERAVRAKVEQDLPSNTVRVVSRAEPSTYPSGPRPFLMLVASAILGLMAGTMIAWIKHLFGGTPEPLSVDARSKEIPNTPSPGYDQVFNRVFAS